MSNSDYKMGTIPEQTAYRVKKRVSKQKDKEKSAEVGLTAATLTGLAAKAGMQVVRDSRKPVKKVIAKKLKKAKEFKKQAESDFYDNPDVELPEETKKRVKGAKKARKAIMGYKLERIQKKKDINANNIKYTPDNPALTKKNNMWDMKDQVREMPAGVDIIGQESGGMFVKEAKPDSKYAKDISPLERKKLHMNRGGIRQEPISETRKRIMNRIIMQEQLGDKGTDTYFYRKKKGSPITMAQEIITPSTQYEVPSKRIKYLEDSVDVKYRDRNALIKAAIKKGIIPKDIHFDNFGYDDKGKPKIMDLGHSASSDYEKLVSQSKFRKALNSTKNVMSPKNKRLYIKMAKQLAKRLPAIGYILGIGSAALSSNPVQAMGEMLTPFDSVGKGSDLASQYRKELAKDPSSNAKMKLEQAKRLKESRQQRKSR